MLNKGIMKSLAKWRTQHLPFEPATQLLRWDTSLHGGGGDDGDGGGGSGGGGGEGGRGSVGGGSVGGSGGLRAAVRRGVAARVPHCDPTVRRRTDRRPRSLAGLNPPGWELSFAMHSFAGTANKGIVKTLAK